MVLNHMMDDGAVKSVKSLEKIYGIEIRGKKTKSLKGLVFCFKAVPCGVQCRFLKMLHYHWSYSVT